MYETHLQQHKHKRDTRNLIFEKTEVRTIRASSDAPLGPSFVEVCLLQSCRSSAEFEYSAIDYPIAITIQWISVVVFLNGDNF
jgi:hypothetical protein